MLSQRKSRFNCAEIHCRFSEIAELIEKEIMSSEYIYITYSVVYASFTYYR